MLENLLDAIFAVGTGGQKRLAISQREKREYEYIMSRLSDGLWFGQCTAGRPAGRCMPISSLGCCMLSFIIMSLAPASFFFFLLLSAAVAAYYEALVKPFKDAY